MTDTFKPLTALLLTLFLTAAASGLEPAEVLVVANANIPESVALAEHYAEVRQIPPENIVMVETTGDYSIARPDYLEQILQPVREHLARRTSTTPIRCICLMWGVPVRVENVAMIAPPELASFFAVESPRRRQRLAIDREYIAKIGRRFPAPGVSGLEPLASVFGPPAPTPPRTVPSLADLQNNIPIELDLAAERIAELTDEDEQRIATHQLLAVYLELYGLEGVIAYAQEHRPAILSDPAPYQPYLDTALAKIAERTGGEGPQTADQARSLLTWLQRARGALAVAEHVVARDLQVNPRRSFHTDASVDSELAMIARPDGYDLTGPQTNTLHFLYANERGPGTGPTIMTCRIDGPTAADALRIIDDSVAVEPVGLDGVFYVDAGVPNLFRDGGPGYLNFDEQLRELAANAADATPLDVVMDIEPIVFPAGSCPNAALYVGWYSLRSYVPAFAWTRGAVGFHVASFEAMHLRNPQSDEWCPKMIQNGVAATLGAVNEPGLDAFPTPRAFFLMLLTGSQTVAECYWRTVPQVSWQMTLICDPLYNPFKARPLINPGALQGLMPGDDWPTAYPLPDAAPAPPAAPPATTQPASPAEPTTQPATD